MPLLQSFEFLFPQGIPQLRLHRAGTDQIHADRLQIQRQIPHHAVQPPRVRGHDAPPGDGLFGHGTRRQGEGSGGTGTEVRDGVFGDEEGREEAHHARLLHLLECSFGERDDGQFVAGGVDDVVDSAYLLEKRLDVGFEGGGGGEVAGVAGHARRRLGRWIAGVESGDGGLDAGMRRGGEYDGAAILETGFRDAEAYAAAAADDEDAGAVQLGGVCLGVGHDGGIVFFCAGRVGVGKSGEMRVGCVWRAAGGV